jgi:hypothetical protein
LRDNLSLALRYQRGRRGLYALGMDSIIGYPIIHAVMGSVKKLGRWVEKPTIPLFYLLYNQDYILVHFVMMLRLGALYNRNLSPVSNLSHYTGTIGKHYIFAQNVMLAI